jgi:prepilin-type N-terminal cleavage/methylation domain-containing protein
MKSKGFTLIELIIVCLIIGMLSAYAVPSYLKSVEYGRAEAAAGLLSTIGTATRMYAIGHQSTYPSGIITDACNNFACPAGPSTNPCALVGCGYIAKDDWDGKHYQVAAVNPSGACSLGIGSGSMLACVRRRSGAFSSWGYFLRADGSIGCSPVCGGSSGPPEPKQQR